MRKLSIIIIWAANNLEDLSNFNQLLTELSSLGAIVEEAEGADKSCAIFVADTPTETTSPDNAPCRVKTVYRKNSCIRPRRY